MPPGERRRTPRLPPPTRDAHRYRADLCELGDLLAPVRPAQRKPGLGEHLAVHERLIALVDRDQMPVVDRQVRPL